MSAVFAAVGSVASTEPGHAALGSRRQSRFEIRCLGCGYGGIVRRCPARCPMCGGGSWTAVGAGSTGSPALRDVTTTSTTESAG